MSFNTFGLSAGILRAVSEQGYTIPTPIQSQTIPAVLKGRDLMAGAQTGTGKTAGFTLPVLQILGSRPLSGKSKPVRCLILTPTRELAAQVSASVKTYGKYTTLTSTVVYGGININPQIKALQKGVDILVATPGRLLDHVEQKTVDLSAVEIFILDEADRMLDMGFIKDIRRIIRLLPENRQNLLFSATFSFEMQNFASSLLRSPEIIQATPVNSAADQVRHIVHPVDHSSKRDLLIHLIKSNNMQQVLVFISMKHTASRLAQQLGKAGINATSIHGDKTQIQRTMALENFKAGKVTVLVATDVASRGLDIQQLPHVINYELPNEPGNYIHRIGRTGRAGNTGIAISLVAADEMEQMHDIEHLLGIEIEKEIVPGFEPDPRIKHKTVARSRKPAQAGPESGVQSNQEAPVEHWSRRVQAKSGNRGKNQPLRLGSR